MKTAFQYVLDNYSSVIGVVTADSDGQHTYSCITKVAEVLKGNQESLVLGCRDFNKEGIPWKSRFGNNLTEKIFSYVAGIKVSDTQTGLRGIPKEFMYKLLDVPGERFEFETQMLLESVGNFPILEVSIETIYDSEENHQTHFNPITDSIKIYKILGRKFVKYVFSSCSSSVIDLTIFTIFCYILKGKYVSYVVLATILARIISATYNYFMNYKIVFQSSENLANSGIKYLLLALVQMGFSAALVSGGVIVLKFIPEVVIKIIVDTILFLISYRIQQKYVFQKVRKDW